MPPSAGHQCGALSTPVHPFLQLAIVDKADLLVSGDKDRLSIGDASPAQSSRPSGCSACFTPSVVTEAEIRFGLAHRPYKAALRASLERMLSTIDILPWTSATARRYGPLRAELAARGKPLAPLDLMIAAHALAEGATLLTADRAFAQAPGLAVQDYDQP
jgi:tRNA(fMet)-specific endonuclease VapC